MPLARSGAWTTTRVTSEFDKPARSFSKGPTLPIRHLEELLSNLQVSAAPGEWCVASLDVAPIGIETRATVSEAEGTSYVITTTDAAALGIVPTFVGSWLTLEVNSSLDAVGLTAAVATALASANIPCNVFAGLHHDHLLVPVSATERAISMLIALRSDRNAGGSNKEVTTALTTLT